jgi:predicted  nucleic acid-binding Zn-ribbon protein
VSTALTLYEQLTEAGEDSARARIFADAFNALEERLPAPDTLATRTQLSETALALTREIEQLRKEIKELDVRLTKEIKELDGRLTKEIKALEREMKALEGRLTREMKEGEVRLVTAMGELKATTIRWVVGLLLGQTGILVAALLGGLRLFASSGP